MASLSRASPETSMTMVFLITMLVTWISHVSTVGITDEHERILDVGAEDIFFEIVEPPELGYTYRIRPAQDFGTPFNQSFLGRKIALVPVEPETGCRTPDNVEELEGNVALVWRGDCTFFQKSTIAENSGARAIIIADYSAKSIDDERDNPLWMDYYYIEMTSGNDETLEGTVNIPAGFMLGKNGRIIRDTLRQLKLPHAIINIPVNLTFAPLTEFHQPPWVAL